LTEKFVVRGPAAETRVNPEVLALQLHPVEALLQHKAGHAREGVPSLCFFLSGGFG
jgi:hypothetical protein